MINRLARMLRGRSLAELASVTFKTLVSALPSERRAEAEHLAANRSFDERWGTDTADIMRMSALDFPVHMARQCVAYEASRPEIIDEIISLLIIDPAEFTFVDIGSGKGMVVICAAIQGFRQTLGLEFSHELIVIARNNASLVAKQTTLNAIPEFIQGDAKEFEAPGGPLLLYLYNPFGKTILNAFLDRVEASARRDRRPIYLAYANPHWAEVINDRESWSEIAAGSDLKMFELKG